MVNLKFLNKKILNPYTRLDCVSRAIVMAAFIVGLVRKRILGKILGILVKFVLKYWILMFCFIFLYIWDPTGEKMQKAISSLRC